MIFNVFKIFQVNNINIPLNIVNSLLTVAMFYLHTNQLTHVGLEHCAQYYSPRIGQQTLHNC